MLSALHAGDTWPVTEVILPGAPRAPALRGANRPMLRRDRSGEDKVTKSAERLVGAVSSHVCQLDKLIEPISAREATAPYYTES